MAASRDTRIPTYHVVPRFDMAAKGGPLVLGAIFRDLKFLRPAINRGDQLVAPPDKLMYTPVTQTGFTETRARVHEGNFDLWAKALSLVGTGASAGVQGTNDAGETLSCSSVTTTYFDPDPDYLKESFEKDNIKGHLKGSSNWTAELYMVTGLKVARDLKFTNTANAQGHVGMQAAAQEPQAGVGTGLDINLAGGNHHDLEFTVDDIVVGYRVNKFRCEWRIASIFEGNKERKIKDDGTLRGEMHGHGDSESEQVEIHFEAVPIPEEAAVQEEAADAAAAGGVVNECWVSSGI